MSVGEEAELGIGLRVMNRLQGSDVAEAKARMRSGPARAGARAWSGTDA